MRELVVLGTGAAIAIVALIVVFISVGLMKMPVFVHLPSSL
jgi:hypothetical protein